MLRKRGLNVMNKNALVAALALVVAIGWTVGARAQDASPPGDGPDSALSLKIQTSHEPAPPGQVGGPVESHPELRTPEHVKEEAAARREYCSKHHDLCIAPGPGPGRQESEEQSIPPGWGKGVADPSSTIECQTDPAHPSGPDLCYRASDHSRVYPGTPGPN
jgi:hypothetical protein